MRKTTYELETVRRRRRKDEGKKEKFFRQRRDGKW